MKSINPNEFQNFVSDNIKSIDITKGIESSIEKVKVLKDLVDGINSSAQSSFQILNKTPFSKEYEKESGKLKARQDQADVEYSNTVLGIDRIANLTTDSLGYKIKDKAALKE